MLTADVVAFVRAALPAPPATVLEVGAGDGELARLLHDAGYDVRPIDPAAQDGDAVEAVALLDAEGAFDAAVAVLSLHHVEPLAASCEHLATLVRPGGRVVIDELDIARLDERAAGWWLMQRAALGFEEEHDAAGFITMMRDHVHALDDVRAALAPDFDAGEPTRCPYLHRWHLDARLRDLEEHLIARGELPAVGARLVARRRGA